MEPEKNNESVQSPKTDSTTVAEPTKAESTTAATDTATQSTQTGEPAGDVSEYRTFAILGYILPFLFFLPLLDDKTKNVSYVRFHANQQLVLLVVTLTAFILHGFLFGSLMMLGYYVGQILNLAILALAIVGVFNAYNNKLKELPFVGQFKILK